MTIDSTWLCAFKEELPHAFCKRNPFRASAVFVDGQIKLMQGPPGEPQTWDDFIYRFGLAWFLHCLDEVWLTPVSGSSRATSRNSTPSTRATR